MLLRDHDGSTHSIWTVCGNRDADLVRAREAQSVVYSRVWGCVRAGVDLRISSRRLAIRHRGGRMVFGRASPLARRAQATMNLRLVLRAGRFTGDHAREASRPRLDTAATGVVDLVDRSHLSDGFASIAHAWPAFRPTSFAGSSRAGRGSVHCWSCECPSFWHGDPAVE